MERGVLTGIAVFRWAAWAWLVAIVILTGPDIVRPWLAILIVILSLALTATLTALLRRRPASLLRPAAIAAELALDVIILVADGFAYRSHRIFTPSQGLATSMPFAGVLAVGVAVGPWWGLAAGPLIGLSRVMGAWANGVGQLTSSNWLAVANTTVQYTVAGGVAGVVGLLLRQAERAISAARAREEVARHLHDSVLQTLALVERRSDQDEVKRLVRAQDRELRAYLFGGNGRM